MSAKQGAGVDSFLGLSPHHEQIVVEYLHSSRFKRTQSLKAIDANLQDLMDSRLVDDTFTSDEVREMLKGFCGVVKADVGADLINSSHTSAQLLRHILQQADKWHLALQVDISEMDNRELLDEIARFEERELNISPTHSFSQSRKQLEPVNAAGGEKLLNLEIGRLEKENEKLKERIRSLESKVSSALSEKDRVKSDLAVAQQTSRESSTESSSGVNTEEFSELQAKIGQLQKQLSEKSSQDGASLKEELSKTAKELLKVTAELKTTKQELELKFSETAQYMNMRKILETKNGTIKELRTKLKRFESSDGK